MSVSNAFAYGLHSLPKDRQLAFEYARRACDQDLGSGCGLLADYYEDTFNDPVQLADGTELVADAAEARALRERACELEAAQYCGLLGQRMLADIDALPEAEREQQRAEALAYLERSCEIGNGSGCTLIAELYLKGSIPSDRKAADAVRYYERVCNNNAPASAGYASYQCVRASTLYYHGGDGLPKSPDKALALANRAAALYPQGDELYRTTIDCMRTGDGFCGLSQKEIDVLEAESTITDITTASAEELLTEAKRINFLGDHTRKQRELEELLAARSCELGSISGCFFLSQLLWYTKERLPGSSDIAAQIRKDQARDVLAKACDQALPSACYRLGLITLYDSFVAYVRFVIVAYTDPKPLAAGADVARGVELIERACELGGLSACQTAGLIHGAGYDERFASADIALARFRKACDMGNAVLSPTSCMLAARLLYNAGTGVSQDREEARRLTLIARDLAQQDDPIKFTEKSTLWVSKIGQCVLQGRNECL